MSVKNMVTTVQNWLSSGRKAAGRLVDEFNEALPTMRGLGFTVRDLRVGTGLVPEIAAKLVASTDTMDMKKIKELIDKHSANRTLVAVLKAIELAFNVRQQVGNFPFKGVEIDVKLGLPPHMGVAFLSTSADAAVAAAASAGNA